MKSDSLDYTPFDVTIVDETDSTNDDLAAAALAGAADLTVLATRFQRAGRGRLGRTWQAPPDTNLLVSVLFRDPTGPIHRYVQRVSVAMANAIELVSEVTPSLKWPNDLLIGDKKLAGVLAVGGGSGGQVEWVVVGVGVNVRWAPEGAALLGDVDPRTLLAAWLAALAERLDVDPIDEYRRRLATLGQMVRVELPTEIIEADAIDITDAGELIIRTHTGLRTLSVGDITHLRHRETNQTG